MGLVELGRKTGLSASFLSQLETGRVVPTLRNLARVALVFGKDLSHFFDSTDPNSHRVFRIQRKKDRVRLPIGVQARLHLREFRHPRPRRRSPSLQSRVPPRRRAPALPPSPLPRRRDGLRPRRHARSHPPRRAAPPRTPRRPLHLRRDPAHLPRLRQKPPRRPSSSASTPSLTELRRTVAS